MIEVLSLGAGVQSSTVLLMSLAGELPKLDYAIFADTGWEPPEVYRQFEWLKELAEAEGVKVIRVSAGNIKEDALRYQVTYAGPETERQLQKGITEDGRTLWGAMPYFVLGPNGDRGQVRRQCTGEYKIQPIETFIRRSILRLRPRQRAPKAVVIRRWYGISWDEQQRMRLNDTTWAVNWEQVVKVAACTLPTAWIPMSSRLVAPDAVLRGRFAEIHETVSSAAMTCTPLSGERTGPLALTRIVEDVRPEQTM